MISYCIPCLIHEVIDLVPPVHLEATFAEAKHATGHLSELRTVSICRRPVDLVNYLILQGPSYSNSQGIERCKIITEPVKN